MELLTCKMLYLEYNNRMMYLAPFLRYSMPNNGKHNLEIGVRRHRSLKMVPFESFSKVSYSHSIVTMAVSCIISDIKRDIG